MFIPIKVVGACFSVGETPAERLLALVFACYSFDGVVSNLKEVKSKAGMSSACFYKAVSGLIRQKQLVLLSRGLYKLQVQSGAGWVNLGWFKEALGKKLPYRQKLVYMAVVKHISQDSKVCWPKMQTIADLCLCSVRAVQRALVKIISFGFLIRKKIKGRWFFSTKTVVPETVEKGEKEQKKQVHVLKLSHSKKIKKVKGLFKKGGFAPKGVGALTGEESTDEEINTKCEIVSPDNKKSFTKPRKTRLKRVVDIMGAVVNKKPQYKNTPYGLASLWTALLPKVLSLDGMYQAALTQKQTAMLKHVLRVGQGYSVDPSTLVEHVLYHWEQYTNAVLNKKGLYQVPGTPQVEWLVKHIDSIYQCYLEFALEERASKVVQKSKPVQVIAKDKILSLEELKEKFGRGFNDCK